ncbi:RNA-directed RNA polymerase [ssRNA phage SRR5466369_2]|uniref:RNA-directed RNA polymerase n=1 Tax=ssRNA phage SRR5466369_2 TaxID=2786405 RepID=A0A8S5L035_9VIRU|nr:RNA-directed RNA polymerase [ssRNA phage SRR5466369_2]DAD50811.1 TPA_asm: RNA-directed RNA polymerase [ssRNA phage SRR5466369_2]
MKSLLTLHNLVLASVGQHCSIGIDRDVSYLSVRWEDEGDSFLTITLPRFAKALERGLETGQWPGHEPLGFKRNGGLPAFMRGFLTRIFGKDGRILDDPDVECVWAVRQVCYLSHKIERDCTPERERAAFSQFVRTDGELIGLPGRIDRGKLLSFERTADRLFGDLFSMLDRKIAHYELVPKHGPGAVAERKSQLEKRSYDYWTERLESVFPYWRYTRNTGYAASDLPIPTDTEIPVRVVSVPKTQATPRIIAIEPSSVQYAQQGLKREIYEWIGKHTLGSVLGFQDQSRNQMLACEASISGSHGTLDLSEASDRVHWFLVWRMVHRWPHLWDFLRATRSYRAQVPGEGIIPLQKFASMGSALTFPLEAMIFTILSLCGIEDSRSTKLRTRDLPGVLSVYGDDIIVPVDTVGAVVDWLEHFGAKVNRAKSFWNGKFRESCGAEYYRGTDVSVVRLRQDLPRSQRDAAELASLVDFRNRCYRAGLWVLIPQLDEELESLIRLPLSNVLPTDLELGRFTPYLARETFLPHHPVVWRVNHDYQVKERRVPYLSPRSESYVVDGEAGLLEWFHDSIRQSDLRDRYDSKERSSTFNIKRRWVEVR